MGLGSLAQLNEALREICCTMVDAGLKLSEAQAALASEFIRAVLLAENGNGCRAAQRLGMHRNNLARLIAASPDLRSWLLKFRRQRKTNRPKKPAYPAPQGPTSQHMTAKTS